MLWRGWSATHPLRREGVGVSGKEISNSVINPKNIKQQSGGRIKYTGENASTILNKEGKVITTFSKNSKAHRFNKQNIKK